MTKRLRFDDEAAEELDMAAAWYETRRDNSGLEFTAAVREALEQIERAPHAWSLAGGVPAWLNVCRVLLP